MKKVTFTLFLILILIHGIFALGNIDNSDNENTKENEETVIFGQVHSENPDKISIMSKSAKYYVIGDNLKEFETIIYQFVFVKGKLTKEKYPKINVDKILVIQDSPDPDWTAVSEVEIEGLVEQGMNDHVCIIVNPDSRSRISHYVYGIHQKKIEEQIGHVVKIKGYVISENEDESPFNKELIVESIIAISEK